MIRTSGLGLCLILAGCGAAGAIGSLLRPNQVAVMLVNNSDFQVDVTLFTAQDQEVPDSLIDNVGTQRDFMIPAGQSRSFSDSCDRLQAIKIDTARLRVLGSIFAPDESTGILRDGTDFHCGDRIVFTFDHSEAIVDFHIDVQVQPAR
jgi:hypothetical protein